jgi:hypothetical protein
MISFGELTDYRLNTFARNTKSDSIWNLAVKRAKTTSSIK